VPHVAGDVVVERDRDRERVTGLPRAHGIEQLGRPDDVVVTAQVLELLCECTARDRGEDLARRVAARAADMVVDERDPRTGRRSALDRAPSSSYRLA
jgi:hypothetical protein